MSYCRWSSDDWQCDVYVWADCDGGYRTEVAGRRHTWDVPLPATVVLPVGRAHTPERTSQSWALRAAPSPSATPERNPA